MQELTFEQVESVSGGAGQFLPFLAGVLTSYAFEATGGTKTINDAFQSFVKVTLEGMLRDIENGVAYD